MTTLTKPHVKPFLKWAGGKGQLLNQIEKFFPQKLKTGKIKKYFEPFLGGGALFFRLSNHYDFENIFLYEINPELVMCYRTIQQDVRRLIRGLEELEEEYLSFTDAKREKFFYEMRIEYNSYLAKKFRNHFIRRSALLIFLNKTCFNGLYRVNSLGQFNVPFGRYKNPTICDEDNLCAVSEALRKAQIIKGDFELCLEHVDSQSFVYFDPPYRPISQTASFRNYSTDVFGDEQQRRLKKIFDKLDKRNAHVMLSNSDPKNINPRDNFFDDLYSQYHLARLDATRMINCHADKRGSVKEILVMNYLKASCGSYRNK